MLFNYEAYDATSRLHRGQLEAGSKEEAESQLWAASLLVLKLAPHRESFLGGLAKLKVGERVKPMEVAFLFRQLATSARVGLPLVTAIELQIEQMREGLLRTIMSEIGLRLREGSTVWEALTFYPSTFQTVYVEIIRGGEAAGNLEEALRRCVTYIEQDSSTVKKVKQGLIYPGFILFGAIGVIVVLVTVVLPAMTKMFSSFGAQLPAPTRLLLAIVAFIHADGLYVAVGLAVIVVAAFFYLRTPGGKLRLDFLLYHMPALGKLIQEATVARFARVLAALLQSAVPLGEIMEIMSRTASNRYFISRLAMVNDRIMGGEGLAVPLSGTGVFPPLVLQIIRVGEESGNLSKALEEVAAYYEEEVEATLKSVLALLEPVLIVGVGAVVGFIAVSVIMPMYSILNKIH